MKIIKISETLNLFLPEGYERKPLPSYNEWLEALRSGKFLQVNGFLHVEVCGEDKYCCLGVLSKIQNRLGKDDGEAKGFSYLAMSNPCYNTFGKDGYFPHGVSCALLLPNGLWMNRETLASLNDCGAPFADIAKVIELIWKPTEHDTKIDPELGKEKQNEEQSSNP